MKIFCEATCKCLPCGCRGGEGSASQLFHPLLHVSFIVSTGTTPTSSTEAVLLWSPGIVSKDRFRQPMKPGGPVPQTYSYSIPSPHRLFKNSSTGYLTDFRSWSQIHERTISLRFLGIILRVLRLEVSVYNIYITNHFCARWGRGRSKIC